jgi:antitoxin (DNA-binding transcriptional repressor) of toxin-antitoxin stability system
MKRHYLEDYTTTVVKNKSTRLERVGIAKIKASLASYFARMRAGESFIITDRGIPVAKLAPVYLDPNDRELVHLVSKGLMMPPEGTPAEQDRWWKEFLGELPASMDRDGLVSSVLLGERAED